MPDIAAIIQSGAANAWLLLPDRDRSRRSARAGARSCEIDDDGIHRRHPWNGGQAVLLALSATVGHTIVVWVLAILAWQMQDTALLEKAEPWLLLVGGLLIVTLALRILSRLGPLAGHPQDHSHPQGHHHAHAAWA